MIHKGRMRNICGCCNLGRQAKKMDVPWTVALRHVQVGTKETNESLKFFFLELSEPKKKRFTPTRADRQDGTDCVDAVPFAASLARGTFLAVRQVQLPASSRPPTLKKKRVGVWQGYPG